MPLEIKKKRPVRKWLLISLSVVALILISAGIFVNVYTERSLPKISGETAISGIMKETTVVRDQEGVPHIKAGSEKDLYMAQGYVQAQDRLFQMDLSRRQASGMLSEAVGEATIDRDKFFRTLGLRRAAKASLSAYDPKSLQVLQWFADGVNAYIKEAKKEGKLPVEFTLLGYEPSKWTPLDSLTIGKYMAFDLGGHWQGQAFRYWAMEQLTKEEAMELFPSYPKDAPAILSSYKDVKLDIRNTFASAVIPREFNGSNNWVVSGKKTVSGKPLLADDPHLGLATPSIWYQMHLTSPSQNVSGVIFAGVPGIILGHNAKIAWGVTNTGPDVQDLYIEKRNPQDESKFLHNGKWEQAKVIKEPIKVKGKETIPYKVTETRHGPVISEFALDKKKDTVLALKWTALMPSTELQAVLNMNRAQNWNDFEKALEGFHVPTQNFVFAGEDGTIAYKANGKIPIRKKGDGLLPVPGWTDEYEWAGFIPWDQLPRSVNPEKRFLATANNKVIDDRYPYHISNHWAQPYRYMRIEEVLAGKEKLSAKDMMKLQMDQKNLYAQEFVPSFLNVLKGQNLTAQEKKALSLLKNWNYEDNAEAGAPLVFHLWMKELPKVLFAEKVPKDMDELFEGKQQAVDELLRKALKGEKSVWIEGKGGIEKVLHSALKNVLADIEDQYGKDPSAWKWGDYHQVYFAHPLSAASPVLEWVFNREKPLPVGGSQVTVQAAAYEEDGVVDHGAPWRFVADLSDLSKAYHNNSPGQSGHFRSRWYSNQLKNWVEGTYHETSLTHNGKKNDVLKLKPAE
ncbi:penicillin acylase family protein [Bacillus sp. FJAT-42376]|uniref:penicillin acylase family protein n=1 Tax=Bacillus sp. FJAT-42376 TaxID=2014076 RepID=UPI000F4EE41D|nr:penicillin acylase family protein [Bacillus sp. FJAT-42376]AZB44945.1 penicillin acylase family protein [Bacillus sp. FJAT-42376]